MKKIYVVLLLLISCAYLKADNINLNIPLSKVVYEVNNSNLDPIAFEVTVENSIGITDNIHTGVGIGFLKSPQIRINKKDKDIKINGGDSTYMPIYSYLRYEFDKNLYINISLGYSIALDSNDIVVNYGDTRIKYKTLNSNSIFYTVKLGYNIKNYSVFIFNTKYLDEQSINKEKVNNINFTGIGISTKF